MKNYRINALQYHVLPIALKEKQIAIANRVGISKITISRHLEDGDFRVSDAIKLSNAYRIGLSQFITTCDELSISGIRTCNSDEWKVLRFNSAEIRRKIFNGQLSYSEITRRSGYARRTVDTILDGKSMMSQLIHLCNSVRINISSFIVGCDVEDIVSADIKSQNAELRAENELLRKRIFELEKMLYKDGELPVVAESVSLYHN